MDVFSALLMFLGTLLMLRVYLVDFGRLGFWKLAHLFLDDFFALMDKDESWVYSSSQLSKPSDDYVGPFFFNKNGHKYTIFALKNSITQSQQGFINKFQSQVPKQPFPIFSLIAMLYPAMSIIYLPTVAGLYPWLSEGAFVDPNGFALLGYGFINLAYLLIVAGIFPGSFKILGLDYRIQVFLAAIVFLVLGTGLLNI